MYRRIMVAFTATALATGACAADLPARMAPPPIVAPPLFSWSGFYFGGQIGYEFGHDSLALAGSTSNINSINISSGGSCGCLTPVPTDPSFNEINATSGGHPHGIIGGGHVGYNFSRSAFYGSNLVFGLEGDVNGADYRENITWALLPDARASTRSDLKGSLRGRLGLAVNRTFFYATGGAAFSNFETRYLTSTDSQYASHARVGYTVGAGIEQLISSNISIRVEYRYSDYGSFSDSGALLGLGSATVIHHETDNIVQAGVSYWLPSLGGPIVARY